MLFLLLFACNTPQGPWDLGEPLVWQPHTLEFCEDYPLGVNRTLDQMDAWYSINSVYDYEYVVHSNCKQEADEGVIRFAAADLDYLWQEKIDGYVISEDYMEVQQREPGKYYQETVRWSSTVYLPWFATNRLIQHEIGHAWGWGHPWEDPGGHLMSHHVGESTAGLEDYY